MRAEHAIGKEVAEPVLRPTVHNAMNDLGQVGARIHVVATIDGMFPVHSAAHPFGECQRRCRIFERDCELGVTVMAS